MKHKYERLLLNSTKDEVNDRTIQQTLDAHSARGWELVSVVPHGKDEIGLFFKKNESAAQSAVEDVPEY